MKSASELDLSKKYTYADYLSWQFDEIVELIKGKVFRMSPAPGTRHQEVSRNLLVQLDALISGDDPCMVFHAPFDVRLPLVGEDGKREISTVVQPDLCIICERSKIDERGCNGAPDLIVEILSRNTAQKDLRDKFEIYQQAAVKEYWVIHPEEETLLNYDLHESGKYELRRGRPFVIGEGVEVLCLSFANLDLEKVFRK